MERTPSSTNSSNTMPATPKTSAKFDNSKLEGELAGMNDRDRFQEVALRAAEWLGKNSYAAKVLVGLALLAGLGFVGYQKFLDRSEKAAFEALYPIESAYQQKRDAFEQAEAPQMNGAKAEGSKASGDLSKDYGQLVDDLAKFANEHSKTTAGAHAALMASETYLKYGKTDEAQKLLSGVVGSVRAQTLWGGLVLLAHGNVMAEAGQCEGALASYQKLLAAGDSKAPHTHLQGEAQLRAGLCFEKMGQKDRAIEMYKKTIELKERGGVVERARTLLRALEIGA